MKRSITKSNFLGQRENWVWKRNWGRKGNPRGPDSRRMRCHECGSEASQGGRCQRCGHLREGAILLQEQLEQPVYSEFFSSSSPLYEPMCVADMDRTEQGDEPKEIKTEKKALGLIRSLDLTRSHFRSPWDKSDKYMNQLPCACAPSFTPKPGYISPSSSELTKVHRSQGFGYWFFGNHTLIHVHLYHMISDI